MYGVLEFGFNMRNKSYRRRQEARHYLKRLKFYRRFGNFGKSWYEIGDSYETKRVYLGETVSLCWSDKPKLAQEPLDLRELWRLKWTKKLRRSGVKTKYLGSWAKKKSNRILRHFLKTIPWDMPGYLHWPKRAEIRKPGYYEDINM